MSHNIHICICFVLCVNVSVYTMYGFISPAISIVKFVLFVLNILLNKSNGKCDQTITTDTSNWTFIDNLLIHFNVVSFSRFRFLFILKCLLKWPHKGTWICEIDLIQYLPHSCPIQDPILLKNYIWFHIFFLHFSCHVLCTLFLFVSVQKFSID